jgi:hypothetical protein
MKKLLLALSMICVLALSARAGEGEAKKEGDKPKKPALTEEQKALKKTMTEKYDADKNGKLNKEERSKMTAEEKAKWDAAFPPKKKADGEKKAEGEAKTETK